MDSGEFPYKNSSLQVNDRVNDLLARMTTEEKINQMDMYWGKEVANMKKHDAASYSEEKVLNVLGKTSIGSIHDFYPISAGIPNEIQKYAVEKTRLGIPVIFIEEGLHGYCGNGSTAFPIPLQLASAWDTTLVRKIGHIIGTESRAHGIHMILAPVLDLARDPRWGRVEETYGEDPYLAALNGVAIVKGMQGNSLAQPDAVIAEPKHFAVHSVPEAGSNTGPVFVGEREARSNFLFTFEKAVREGGAKGIMAAYHELDGIPCVSNKWLLTDVLRKEWGFTGFVLSDLGAIHMTINNHMTAKDTTDALTQTIKAGMNMQFYDFSHKSFKAAINQALTNKTLSEEELNGAVRDILRVKFMLGLFENPYVDTLLISKVFHSQENQELALKAAQESIILLKNENSVLPLKREKLRIAVIGELAESNYPGGYTSPDKEGISILDGLKQRAGANQVIAFEKGYTYNRNETANKQKAVDLAKNSDVAIVVIGENLRIVGEGKDRSDISLGKDQMELIQAIQATGKPVVAVLFNGRPLVINWIAENVPAIVETWFSGEKGGLAIADVLFGKVNPSGKLPVTFPRSVGQIPFYYNHKPSSKHNYVDVPNTPLYPFGYGLSYTTFEYSGIKISPETIPTDGTATVKISVKNTGLVEGTEVVQMYVRDEIGSVTTPVKSLKGFSRVTLQPGEVKEVSFKIGPEALWLWNREMKRVVEPGTFKIMIGSSSNDRRQQATLTVTETQTKLYPLSGENIARLTADFTSPFNGKDLTGWCYRSKQQGETFFEPFDGKNESRDARFTGRDGVLTVNPWDEAKGPHLVSIWTTQDYQGDFSFTIEFRAGVNADSGIFLRGTQLQCRDYLVAGPYKSLKNYKPQDWNKIEVVVKDNIAHCTCNGEILEEALKISVTGPLGLEADRGLMEYRNILIKALK
jgi:beta-glucosidase